MKKFWLNLIVFFGLFFLCVYLAGEYGHKIAKRSKTNEAQAALRNDTSTTQAAKKATTEETKMDQILTETIDSMNSFISQYRDNDGGIEDVWWDSKNTQDLPFKRIRLCKADDYSWMCMERRPFPFTKKLEVIGYTITREKRATGDGYQYFMESSRFEKNLEIESARKREYIVTAEEMEKATEPFRKRIAEARENIPFLNGRQEKEKAVEKITKNG